MADLTITAERLNELKAKVKAEMQRRNSTEHGASLSSYAGTAWDFSTTPKNGDVITDEHVQKVIDPLIEVNDFLYDNSFRTGKSGLEQTFYKAEKYVDSISKIGKTDANSGCRGACTGLCQDACVGQCLGCSGTCQNQCQGCSHTCGSGCQTSLKY